MLNSDDSLPARVVRVCLVFLVVALTVAVLGRIAGLLRPILIPFGVALLLTGLLMPLNVLLNHRLRLPRLLAATVTLFVAIGVIAGVLTVAGTQLANGLTQVRETTAFELSSIHDWLASSPLPVGKNELEQAVQSAADWAASNSGSIAGGALGAGYGAASFLVGTILCLFTVIFLLAQGDRIFAWVVALLPVATRERTYEAGRRGWVTLSTYARMQVVLAGIDAAGIGVGAAVMGVPFVIPLTALTFVLCLVPFVGALVSGALVVLVALALKGPTVAIIMLVIVIVVQQLESDLFQPLLMSKAVDVHPLVVLLGVAGATYVVGFVGALFAVPLIASLNTMAKYLRGRDPFPMLAHGSSALTGSPRKLAGEVTALKVPARIGEATIDWLDQARSEQVRQAEASAPQTSDEADAKETARTSDGDHQEGDQE